MSCVIPQALSLLYGLKNPFGVIPWLGHGIQKTTKNTNIISIFNWIPRSSRGMTEREVNHATKPTAARNDGRIYPRGQYLQRNSIKNSISPLKADSQASD
ncbi:putative ampG [Rickettsia endosymbiont of Ixodes pacificus]|nr:putative ampG [Rickettsia endosymbiont of Ixodes pacificus]